ncbi:MAG TPA: DUF503 domain-containing protein [Candidatus Polarisedimenticolia bacterium]|jgi:hypothetical protein|nr:DUF503 domain-containing protein [Candidatus Polarisedimenticolia bacterium]
MNVGLCIVEIHLSASHSLKDKRRVLRRLKDRLKSRFNVSVAEIDHQDLWQRATLGIVSIAAGHEPLESCFGKVRGIVESEVPGEVVNFEIEYLT